MIFTHYKQNEKQPTRCDTTEKPKNWGLQDLLKHAQIISGLKVIKHFRRVAFFSP